MKADILGKMKVVGKRAFQNALFVVDKS